MKGFAAGLLGPGAPLGAFRSPHYRLFWLASLVVITGLMLQRFAQAYLVFKLTGSPLQLGIVSTFQAVPAIAFTLVGGALADRMDRRRLVILAQGVLGLLSLVLALDVTLGWVEVWHLWALALVVGLVQAFETPARRTLVPALIPSRQDMASGVALFSLLWDVSRIVGPGLAGVILAWWGLEAPFFLTAGGFFVMCLALARLRVAEVPPMGARGSLGQEMADSLRFIGQQPIFRTLISISLYVGFFGLAYIQFLVVFADEVHQVGPIGFGLMGTILAVGTISGGVVVAFLGRAAQQGSLLVGGGCLAGLALAGFAMAPGFTTALALLALSGFAMNFFNVATQTILQLLVPDALRGRVLALWGLIWRAPELGALPLGATADMIGIRAAVGLWGLLVAAGVAATGLVPQVRRLGGEPVLDRA